MNARDYVALEYGSLAVGERKSGQLCPSCNGGSGKEKSFAVIRGQHVLSFVCFRASCQFRGTIRLTSGGSAAVHQEDERPKVSAVVASQLPPKWEEYLSNLFSIEQGMFTWAKWKYTDSYNGNPHPRIGMPIIGPDGETRGITWRSYSGQKPKALIEKLLPTEEMMCWYRARRHGRSLVIVEDQPSALRVASQGVDALALCGVLLTLRRIQEIKAQGYDHILLCLDDDATRVAVTHAVEFKARLPQLRVYKLSEDIKNMSPENFELFIQEVTQT